MKSVALILQLFFATSLIAQDFPQDIDGLKLCAFIQGDYFSNDEKADRALEKILSVIGVSKNFVLRPCGNINNAVAISYKGVRYIMYDKEFMKSLSAENQWNNLFILAHEVGHHINGHSLDLLLYASEMLEPKSLAQMRKQELEADEFAAFILSKLGASLEETTSSINLLASEGDDFYSTHPAKSKRLLSVETGYNRAVEKINIVKKASSGRLSSEDLFYRGVNYADNNLFNLAIMDFNKSIKLNPNAYEAYVRRGHAYLMRSNEISTDKAIADAHLALKDFNKAIEIEPYEYWAYHSKGLALSSIAHYSDITKSDEAIEAFSRAIILESEFSQSYWFRAFTKRNYLRAMGYDIAYDDTNDDMWYPIVMDLNCAIELDPTYNGPHRIRAEAKFFLSDWSGACDDYFTAESMGAIIDHNGRSNFGIAKFECGDVEGSLYEFSRSIDLREEPYYLDYFYRSISKAGLEDYNGAINDLNQAILLNPTEGLLYNQRAIIYFLLEDMNRCCADVKIAKSLGFDMSDDWCK